MVDKVQKTNQDLTFLLNTSFQYHLRIIKRIALQLVTVEQSGFSSAPDTDSLPLSTCPCQPRKNRSCNSANFQVPVLHQAPAYSERAWNTTTQLLRSETSNERIVTNTGNLPSRYPGEPVGDGISPHGTPPAVPSETHTSSFKPQGYQEPWWVHKDCAMPRKPHFLFWLNDCIIYLKLSKIFNLIP